MGESIRLMQHQPILSQSCAALGNTRCNHHNRNYYMCQNNPVDARGLLLSITTEYRLSENAKSIEEALDREAGRKLAGPGVRDFGTAAKQIGLTTELFSSSIDIPPDLLRRLEITVSVSLFLTT